MSTFAVGTHTINRIIHTLKYCDLPGVAEKLKDAGYNLTITELAERLANDMFLLNCQAVDYRCGTANTITPSTITLRDCQCSKIQGVKSLDCWLYQCTEGSIPNTALYRLMKEIRNYLTKAIISSLPEYSNAEWD